MKLHTLLQGLTESLIYDQCEINGLTLNSHQVKPGELFIAIKGSQVDGRSYIRDAISKGASAILAEAQGFIKYCDSLPVGMPLVLIDSLSSRLDIIAKRFYQDPSRHLSISAVTGTNGKTSTCYLSAQALTYLNIPCGIIGTLGHGTFPSLLPCALTTPDSITLQKYFYEFVRAGTKLVMMEASSHALAQERLQGIPIESGIFTNLTHDHLDYHLDRESYGREKEKLFKFPTLKRAIINADSDYTPTLLSNLPTSLPRLCYSITSESDVYVEQLNSDNKGIQATLRTPWGKGKLRTTLLGEFNLSNLLACLTELCLRDIPLKDALEALSKAEAPPGRMQKLIGPLRQQIVIDYAHTPDALTQVLKVVRKYSQSKVWCIFGCGGERDKSKRPLMGQAAAEIADNLIITNDNPRSENPSQIAQDILSGISVNYQHKVQLELNRQEAIYLALSQSQANDIILIAGKGHENYQLIGNVQHAFSDADIVKRFLSKEK